MIRLDRFLSNMGRGTRKEVKKMISEGAVTVNGIPAADCAMAVDEQNDQVFVCSERVFYRPFVYLMMNKPSGVLSASEDRGGAVTAADLVAGEYAHYRVSPAGRLDKDSEGLLLMTDDGALTHRLTHPSHEVEKEYRVWVNGDTAAGLPVLRGPMSLDGVPLRPARVTLLEQTPRGDVLSVVIHEGKNRQVRRMCDAAGLTVKRLVRVREGALALGALPSGRWRRLTGEEIALLQEK